MLRVQLARTKRPKARLGGPEPRSRIHGLVITLLIGSLATAGSAQAQGSRSLEIADIEPLMAHILQ